MKFLLFLSFFPGFLVALTVHEAAHALVSKWLGDRYAEKQGRISLNPMRHLSALGTLMLFVIGFGWGKPVPVNLYNYKHPKFYYLLSSLAGPLSNILLCLISLVLIYGLNVVCQTERGQTNLSGAGYIGYSLLWLFLYSLIYINTILAIVNLIPIPPLDGSKIWPCLIPKMRPVFSGKATWLWIVILIMVMRGDTLSKVISPVMHRVESLMPGMLQRVQLFPADFPEEMKPPQEANYIHYERNRRPNGDPNALIAGFWFRQPYPAEAHRRQLSKMLSERSWVQMDTGGDPNHWTLGDIEEEEGYEYRDLAWSQRWKKENSEFRIDIWYETEPNSVKPKDEAYDEAYIEYKYTIMNPVDTK
jgi:Zn-dependent protease